VGLAGDWALWRDCAVRSTGFGIAGLEAFGAPDEEQRLAQVARDPRFREAVAWQSREALRGGVDKLAAGGESPHVGGGGRTWWPAIGSATARRTT
jgi:hypothetical protein